MKKSFTFAFALLLSAASFAQLSWNAKVGLNLSNFIGKDVENCNVKPGIRIGAGMEYAFNDIFALQPSLFFSQKGCKSSESEDIYGTTIKGEIKSNQLYLEVPINAQARFKVTDKINVTVCAGPYLACGIGGKTKMEASMGREEVDIKMNTFGKIDKVTVSYNGKSEDIPVEDVLGESDADGLKRFDAGIGVGIGLEYNSFMFNIDSQFGCVNLQKDASAKNINVGLTVGYRF